MAFEDFKRNVAVEHERTFDEFTNQYVEHARATYTMRAGAKARVSGHVYDLDGSVGVMRDMLERNALELLWNGVREQCDAPAAKATRYDDAVGTIKRMAESVMAVSYRYPWVISRNMYEDYVDALRCVGLIGDDERLRLILGYHNLILGYDASARLPDVALDDLGRVDWKANGWPEPTPFFWEVDTSMMPEPVRDYWEETSRGAEEAYSNQP